MTLVLASTSPRRYHLLSLLNLPFLMVSPDGPEVVAEDRAPAEEARFQARRKAASVAAQFPEAVLIGSDTLVSLDGAKIGKPRSVDDARDILRRLRGRSHEVVTAVVLVRDARVVETIETARVTMRAFTHTELEQYLATDDSLDKAGAYSVQGLGRSLIVGVTGEYLAVVGLPLRTVADGLRQFGVEAPVDLDRLYRERNVLNWRTFA